MAEVFRHAPGALPSDLVEPAHALDTAGTTLTQLTRAGVAAFGIRLNGTADYPQPLRDTSNPPDNSSAARVVIVSLPFAYRSNHARRASPPAQP